MKTALETDGLRAAHGSFTAIEGISFRIHEGERVVLLGPNGAGKTTLLRTLTGLHPPAGGRVQLFGRAPRDIPAPERARMMAVVPQELFAPMPFAVGEIVLMGRTAGLPRWRHPGRDDRAAAERAMEFMDVFELRNRSFDTLSGGERQRAAIAMALAREPRVLLLDEPTSHLDVQHRFEILRLLIRLHREQGLVVLMSSHDLDLAARFGERLLLLDRGRLAADGSPREVLTEKTLRSVYRCELRVDTDPDGVPRVLPPEL